MAPAKYQMPDDAAEDAADDAAADAPNNAREFSVLDDPVLIVREQSLSEGGHTASVTSHVDPDEMTVTDFDDSTEDALGLPDS